MKAQRFLSQPSVLFPSAVTIKHSLQNIYKPLAFPVKKLWLTQDHDYIPALFSAPTLPLISANLSLSLHFVFGAADKIQNSFQMSGPQNIHTDGRGPLITQLKLQWLIMLTILKLSHFEKGFIAMIEGRGISFMRSWSRPMTVTISSRLFVKPHEQETPSVIPHASKYNLERVTDLRSCLMSQVAVTIEYVHYKCCC